MHLLFYIFYLDDYFLYDFTSHFDVVTNLHFSVCVSVCVWHTCLKVTSFLVTCSFFNCFFSFMRRSQPLWNTKFKGERLTPVLLSHRLKDEIVIGLTYLSFTCKCVRVYLCTSLHLIELFHLVRSPFIIGFWEVKWSIENE